MENGYGLGGRGSNGEISPSGFYKALVEMTGMIEMTGLIEMTGEGGEETKKASQKWKAFQ